MSICGSQYSGKRCQCLLQVTPGLTPATQTAAETTPICAYLEKGFMYACDPGCCSNVCTNSNSEQSSATLVGADGSGGTEGEALGCYHIPDTVDPFLDACPPGFTSVSLSGTFYCQGNVASGNTCTDGTFSTTCSAGTTSCCLAKQGLFCPTCYTLSGTKCVNDPTVEYVMIALAVLYALLLFGGIFYKSIK